MSKGGVASSTKIYSGGNQVVNTGGLASATTVNSSGYQFVHGIARKTTLNNSAYQHVYDGGVASSTTIKSKGRQDLDSDGTAISTKLNGGFQGVWSGGVASSTTINDQGNQNVASGGKTIKTTINSGGQQHVFSGGSASNTTINNGGAHQSLHDGGVAKTTTINSGGFQYVESDGIAIVTTVNSNGSQKVRSGGMASKTTVKSGGNQIVFSGGVARVVTVNKAGALIASAGAVVSSVTLKAGASMTMAAGNKLYGKNSFTNANVTGDMVLAKNATLTLGATTRIANLNVANASLTVTAAGNSIESLQTNKNSKIAYNVSKLAAKGDTTMLKLPGEKSGILVELMDVKNAQERGTPLLEQPFDSFTFYSSQIKKNVTLQFRSEDAPLYSGNNATYATLSTAFKHALVDYEADNPSMKGVFSVSLGDNFTANSQIGNVQYQAQGRYIEITSSNGTISTDKAGTGWGISSGLVPALSGLCWRCDSYSIANPKKLGQFSVTVAKNQGIGTYELLEHSVNSHTNRKCSLCPLTSTSNGKRLGRRLRRQATD